MRRAPLALVAPRRRAGAWLALATAALSGCGVEPPIALPMASADAGAADAKPDGATDAPADRGDPFNVDAPGPPPPPTGPALLSETGLYSDIASRTLAADLIPYAPRFEFWADGAAKMRYLHLPPGTRIDIAQINDWVFPVGTKVWKEFHVGGKLVETRLLQKVRGVGAGGWWMVSYVWRSDGTDAVATPEGATNALGTTHDVPDQTQCANCHQNVRDVLLGVSALQLGDPAATPRPIDALAAAGRLSGPAPPDLDVPGSGVVKDALSYLHVNCGTCHNDEAPRLTTQTPLRLRLLVGQTDPHATGAYTTTVGTVMKHSLDEGGVTTIVTIGDPAKSGLWDRMNRRDDYGMPPIATKVVDEAGVQTIGQWITAWP